MRKRRDRIRASVIAFGILIMTALNHPWTAYASEIQGSVTIADVLGMDGAAYIEWLESHESDDYYIGTPYCPGWVDGMSGDYRNPNGDCQGAYGEADRPGVAGMNCTGFVWHALYKPTLASGGNTSMIPAISGWVTFYRNYNIRRYYFSSKAEMLNSGVLEKGDIIWSFDGGSESSISDNHHVGIFWGDDSHEDRFWHSVNVSNTTNQGWNVITDIQSKVQTSLWVVVKAGGVTKGYANLTKVSADTSVTSSNSCYSLEGAVYGVYSDLGCTDRVDILTTDRNGNTNTIEMKKGNYWVKEISAPVGYGIDQTVYPVSIMQNQTTTISASDAPFTDTGLELLKIDQETGSSQVQGAATLEGAQFTVTHYAGYYTQEEIDSSKPQEDGVQIRTWVLEIKRETAEDEIPGEDALAMNTFRYYAGLSDGYKVSGDDFYYDSSGNQVLPLGTLTVKETKAPEGYLPDDTFKLQRVLSDDSRAYLEGGNTYTIADRVIRGDLAFVKKDRESQMPMAGIPFRITSNTTGESHIVVTDENGEFNSASKYHRHSVRTNMNDDVASGEYQSGSGVWFGLDETGKDVPVDDTCGAFPYDTYTIEELRCEANEGKALIELFSFTISRENYTVKLGTINNSDITLKTTAKCKETDTQIVEAKKDVTIIDTVSYTGLKKGCTYKIIGTLMNKETECGGNRQQRRRSDRRDNISGRGSKWKRKSRVHL